MTAISSTAVGVTAVGVTAVSNDLKLWPIINIGWTFFLWWSLLELKLVNTWCSDSIHFLFYVGINWMNYELCKNHAGNKKVHG